eukprot:scaffold10322_cov290-Chaetoceros_neogracile.AAC.2
MMLPCFMPASQSGGDAGNYDHGGQTDMTSLGDDPLDFDLLAEYLLDDCGSALGPTFDFSSDSPTNEVQQPSCIVSPDFGSSVSLSKLQGMSSIPVIRPDPAAESQVLAPAATQAQPGAIMSPPMMSFQGIIPVAPNGAPHQMIAHQHKRQRLDNGPKLQQPVQLAANRSTPALASIQQSIPSNAEELSVSLTDPTKTARQKSQAQIDRRRERNRILARRTRLRKKFFFESLRKEVMELQKDNMALKEIVRTNIEPEKAKPILAECKVLECLPEAVLEHCGDPSNLGAQDFNLMSSIRQSQQCFVISDPTLPDNPIVYASGDFLSLTGYSQDEVLGRNCRFLQGPETDEKKVAKIHEAVENGEDVTVTFVNYKADGTAFWNKLFIAALRDAENNIVNYIGVSVKVAGPEPEDPESGKSISGGIDRSNASAAGSDDGHIDANVAVLAVESADVKADAAAPTMTQSLS